MDFAVTKQSINHAMIAKFLLIIAFCTFAAEVIALLIYKTNNNDH